MVRFDSKSEEPAARDLGAGLHVVGGVTRDWLTQKQKNRIDK